MRVNFFFGSLGSEGLDPPTAQIDTMNRLRAQRVYEFLESYDEGTGRIEKILRHPTMPAPTDVYYRGPQL